MTKRSDGMIMVTCPSCGGWTGDTDVFRLEHSLARCPCCNHLMVPVGGVPMKVNGNCYGDLVEVYCPDCEWRGLTRQRYVPAAGPPRFEDTWCPPGCGCGRRLQKPEEFDLEPLTDEPKHRIYDDYVPLERKPCQDHNSSKSKTSNVG